MYDRDKLGKDERIGKIILDLRKIIKSGGLFNVCDNVSDSKPGKLLWSAQFYEAKTSESTAPEAAEDDKVAASNETKALSHNNAKYPSLPKALLNMAIDTFSF